VAVMFQVEVFWVVTPCSVEAEENWKCCSGLCISVGKTRGHGSKLAHLIRRVPS
jgi:hypothetical protein